MDATRGLSWWHLHGKGKRSCFYDKDPFSLCCLCYLMLVQLLFLVGVEYNFPMVELFFYLWSNCYFSVASSQQRYNKIYGYKRGYLFSFRSFTIRYDENAISFFSLFHIFEVGTIALHCVLMLNLHVVQIPVLWYLSNAPIS